MNLSEHLVDDERSEHFGYIHAPWVRDFIRKLKNETARLLMNDLEHEKFIEVMELIDELAGPHFSNVVKGGQTEL